MGAGTRLRKLVERALLHGEIGFDVHVRGRWTLMS
jgi:hypothetical protein